MAARDQDQIHALLEKDKRLEKGGDFRDSAQMYRRALSIAPDDSRELHRLGVLAYRSLKLKQAEGLIQKAIQQEPNRWQYYKSLGNVLRRLNRFEAAKDSFKRALKLNPESAETYYDFGLLCQTFSEFEQALKHYRRCLELKSNYPQAYNNAGLIYMQRNEVQAAEGCFKTAIQQDCTFAGAHLNLGELHRNNGDHQRAVACFQTAIRYAPDMPEAYRCLGLACQAIGKVDEAIDNFTTVIRFRPKSAIDWVNLGTAYHENGSLNKAMECYQKALSIDSQLPQALLNAGIVHRERHQYDEALVCFQKALKNQQDYENALAQLVALLIHLCDWKWLPRYNAMLDQATQKAIAANKKPDETPFLSLIRSMQPLRNFQVAQAWSTHTRSNVSRWRPKLSFNGRRKNRRVLRVGYLSGNFQNHPTSELILGLLKGHDRNRFEVITYSYGKDDDSIQRKDIVAASDRFNDLYRVDDKQAVDLIYNDGVDILIDLMGHTRGARMQICASRPAPVQVRYLGMAGTTGADFFDYIVVDRIVCPIEHERFYSEKPVYMPFCYQVNNYASRWPDNHLEDYTTLVKKPFVFCCFATAYKINATVFQIWMKILQQVPNSVLWLMPGNKTVEHNLHAAAMLMGVNPDRVVFKQKLPLDQHLRRLREAHLALDTLTVNGAATTSDALWAGLPVLTVKGRHFASRMTESLLRTVGLPEMVASDLKQYEKKAVEFAKTPVELADIRKKLKQFRVTSPLFDTDRFLKAIETGFEVMWQRFLDNEKPSPIHIANLFAS